MIDSQTQQLAKAVYGGELSAAGPLLDRLNEIGDVRVHRLNWHLGSLMAKTTQTKEATRYKGGGITRGRRTESSPEEMAYRADEAKFHIWMEFSTVFEVMFWAELHGLLPLNALVEAENILNAPKQAKRVINFAGEQNMGEDVGYAAQSGSSYSPDQNFP